MKKYWSMAADNGNTVAMYNLGYHYHYEQIDYELMKKYYLLVIEGENEKAGIAAMCQLGFYYRDVEKDYIMMEKYWLISSDKGCKQSKRHLEEYYISTSDDKSLLKFYKLHNKNKLINKLSELLQNTSNELVPDIIDIILDTDLSDVQDCPIYIILLQKALKEKIDIMSLHFNYSLEGKGFIEAKNDFLAKIIN
jgi:hypothetical protein